VDLVSSLPKETGKYYVQNYTFLYVDNTVLFYRKFPPETGLNLWFQLKGTRISLPAIPGKVKGALDKLFLL
jgi:hypothetical protein